ncbi:MAG: aminoacyl-tRNA hydrolase [Treponema sp.]|jgi:PTH1 family peptidyl-tRNA hydrolase|nr:aminoacyl-tRNA hydrolase [Treponema sp.]
MVDLVVFLGNPGRQYALNRHNAGWLFAEALPFFQALSWQKKYKGSFAQAGAGFIGSFLSGPDSPPEAGGNPAPEAGIPDPSRKIAFLKPETFMNVSGEAAAAAAVFFKLKAPSILVVHDELELPLGAVSLKFAGGLGGHNGLRSLKACLGSPDFWRLRFGIGRPDDRLPGQGGPPGSGRGIVDWVLSDFGPGEAADLDTAFARTAPAFMRALLWGPETLLPAWGKKRLLESEGPGPQTPANRS